MKESEFIQQNKDKWQSLEAELNRGDEARPDRITHLYIDSVDDLSFARTSYPNRMVRAYLNGVVEVLSHKVQRSQSNYWRSVVQFWKTDLPLAAYEGRRQFLLSFIILTVSIGIGIFSSMHDESFASYILGPDYIAVTLENIEKGDPLAIYKSPGMGDMFFRITFNNIMVSARTFLLSLFLGFGTVLVIIYNGVMLGVFQYFFIERGLFFESFLTIWQHGVIEISCIVLAGAAGLVLAKGILFPGSYSRIDSFRINGRKSLKIMLGLMPLLVLSGAIESYVTRFTDVHWSIRLLSILLSLTFIIFYFIIYPRMVARGLETEKPYVDTRPIVTSEFTLGGIKTNASIFWESMRIFFSRTTWLVYTVLGLWAVLTAIWWFGIDGSGNLRSSLSGINATMWFMHTQGDIMRLICSFLVISSSFVFAHKVLQARFKDDENASEFTFSWKNVALVSVLMAILETASLIHLGLAFAMGLFFPVLGLLMVSTFYVKAGERSAWKITTDLLAQNYGRLLALVSFYGFAVFLVSVVLRQTTDLVLIEFISNFVMPDSDTLARYLIPALLAALSLFVFTGLSYIAFHLSFYTLREIRSATSLTQKLEQAFPKDDSGRVEKVAILRKDIIAG